MPFDFNKLVDAIFKAAASVGGTDRTLAVQLAEKVIAQLNSRTPTVEEVQDLVEKTLIEEGHAKTAKAYILYRYKKSEERERRALILGEKQAEEQVIFSNDALAILERRYLIKDSQGNLLETPQQMLLRVAENVAQADGLYGASKTEIKETAQTFYDLIASLRFLPNSPTLMNAGTKSQQLSSCFVLPIEDTMEGIFGTLRDAAVIHQRGSGTGFSFSRLRPKGDSVGENQGVAAGPVAFLGVYDAALNIVKQGGVRPGANMAVLRVDHPDIIRFIESKREKKRLKNFNISVAVTDTFMRAVEEDREYYIWNPRLEKYSGKLRGKDVFAVITQNAWKTGDPGLIFIDEINRKHPAKHLGEIETTNQCGEAPLLPNEGCPLGSINLSKFIQENEGKEGKDLDWEGLKNTIRLAVHFLDNLIDQNEHPSEAIKKATQRTRKFGLGIMGLADTLFALTLKYDSDPALEMAGKIMSFVKEHSYARSMELAEQRGVCPAWEESEHHKAGRKMRNMTCNSISPTGTISILAGTSSGCEPLFGLSYVKTVLGSNEIIYLNPIFESVARERGFYSPELMRKVAKMGTIQELKEIPKDVRDLFVTAQDINPEWHIRMQATLQKYVDNSISKTINFPRTASIRDVEEAYFLAWKAKCKGITIYRDGSYEDQVISIGESG
ncbi:MAG: ribonucleoside-diphosphate reductase, adenosylcobalamin-dependent [Omnitrophica bacterium RIFCSPLOWO2_01_FULL_45_10]|nr:MAG: ribonucleoside-diphosphate reductase, adenosylcobalamin-dependent [Omnitrophica bacterium RIFCSPLOWO2_01_FULL_45_10]